MTCDKERTSNSSAYSSGKNEIFSRCSVLFIQLKEKSSNGTFYETFFSAIRTNIVFHFVQLKKYIQGRSLHYIRILFTLTFAIKDISFLLHFWWVLFGKEFLEHSNVFNRRLNQWFGTRKAYEILIIPISFILWNS